MNETTFEQYFKNMIESLLELAYNQGKKDADIISLSVDENGSFSIYGKIDQPKSDQPTVEYASEPNISGHVSTTNIPDQEYSNTKASINEDGTIDQAMCHTPNPETIKAFKETEDPDSLKEYNNLGEIVNQIWRDRYYEERDEHVALKKKYAYLHQIIAESAKEGHIKAVHLDTYHDLKESHARLKIKHETLVLKYRGIEAEYERLVKETKDLDKKYNELKKEMEGWKYWADYYRAAYYGLPNNKQDRVKESELRNKAP